MSEPLYIDYADLRFNTNLNALEYNSGNEVWLTVPGSPFSGGVVTGATTFNVPLILPNHSMAGTGTVTPSATVSSSLYTTVTGDLTLNGPTGGYDGQKITLRLKQDGTGHSVTLATGAGNFRFGTDIPSFTASAANLTDYLEIFYNAPANCWDVVAVNQGF